MAKIEVRFRFPNEPSAGLRQYEIQFTHWFPLGEEDVIRLEEDGVAILIHFDFKCIGNIGIQNVEQIGNWVNVMTRSILATLTADVSDSLYAYMIEKDYRNPLDDEMKHLEEECSRLTEKLHALAIKRINRPLSYAKRFHGWFSSQPFGG